MQSLIIVNKITDWEFDIPDVLIIPAKTYLTDSRYAQLSHARVYNLCQSYRYQGLGYYVSLLAEARAHRSFPNIITIQDLKSQSIIRIISDELELLIQRSLARLRSNSFDLNIYFGKSVAKQYEHLSKQLYSLFQVPLLSVSFTWQQEESKWVLKNISPLPLNQIPAIHKPYILEFAHDYFGRKRIRSKGATSKLIYDLAILCNPKEKSPPSNKKALEKFIQAAESNGMRTKFINKTDYNRIPEFDALFIRETTAVNHHTYRFARRARAENLVVIDDPISIVRCANKVYMAEMMKKAHIPMPKTVIVHRKNSEELVRMLGLPYILKQPDGSFSSGVLKVESAAKVDETLNGLLNQSDLIIAQEFVPTPFDWRIGILNKQPLYACKYYMAKDHWQINQWDCGKYQEGKHETIPLDQVPVKVLKVAQKAANLIGDGLYGVDLKEYANEVLVIEINDNPNIDHGVEDQILEDELYHAIMQSVLKRIKLKKHALE